MANVPRDRQGRQLRPDPCPFCGALTKRRARTGKLRYRHQCPHGLDCPKGDPRIGMHANTYPPASGCSRCRITFLRLT